MKILYSVLIFIGAVLLGVAIRLANEAGYPVPVFLQGLVIMGAVYAITALWRKPKDIGNEIKEIGKKEK